VARDEVAEEMERGERRRRSCSPSARDDDVRQCNAAWGASHARDGGVPMNCGEAERKEEGDKNGGAGDNRGGFPQM
jgi:hypothetical protein